ncbi:hypothetical protein PVAP13_6KG221100 [Panicum virgatum]|uniref:Uncharacterized protein n=1 Tax=Panicum virgatum TaxID=38727 RepID=A0A8T0RFE1_PANVG|nr:hypothetical protein PVAP13_6KG221100 [Panicum virgatum]
MSVFAIKYFFLNHPHIPFRSTRKKTLLFKCHHCRRAGREDGRARGGWNHHARRAIRRASVGVSMNLGREHRAGASGEQVQGHVGTHRRAFRRRGGRGVAYNLVRRTDRTLGEMTKSATPAAN